jgi:hypothetical protein
VTRLAGAAVTLLLAACAACHRDTREPPANAPADIELPARFDPAARARHCDAQAARFAAGHVWGNRSAAGAADVLLRWQAHFSDKHQECDVLVEHRVSSPGSSEVVYSELWEPFDAQPLAAWTGDPRPDVRRAICRIEISDYPSVSCPVARFFIDDHLLH